MRAQSDSDVDVVESDEPESDPRLAATAILDRRSDAVMEGDRDAFLAPIDPIDPYAPTFLRQQGMIYRPTDFAAPGGL